MKKLILISPLALILFLLLSSLFSYAQNYSHSDSLNSIIEQNRPCNYMIRTYNIEYDILHNLDTTNISTIHFLNLISSIIKEDTNIRKVEIGIHLSIKWSNEYSINADKMWEQIILYLSQCNIDSNKLYGIQYFDTKPLKELDDFENMDDFLKNEQFYNARVEFVFWY